MIRPWPTPYFLNKACLPKEAWSPEDHPRDEAGRFGGGGGKPAAPALPSAQATRDAHMAQVDTRKAELEGMVERGEIPHVLEDPLSSEGIEHAALTHMKSVLERHADMVRRYGENTRNYVPAYVTDSQGKLIAAGDMTVGKQAGYINNVGSVVRGTGAKVMDKLMMAAKAKGISYVDLESESPQSDQFYEKIGFSRHPNGSWRMYVKNWRRP